MDGLHKLSLVQEEWTVKNVQLSLKGAHCQCGQEGLKSNHRELITFLKACAIRKDLYKGKRIHALIVKRGLLETNTYLGNSLLHMYAQCGDIEKVREVFDALPICTVVSCNTLIAGYIQLDKTDAALVCFEWMQGEGFSPNTVTYICILKACGSLGAAEKGAEIHADVARQGLLGKFDVLGTALVDMYAKCGVLAKAQIVFDELPVQCVGSWNALITGYTQHGRGTEAMACFERMIDRGIPSNAVTFACILKACSSIGTTKKGEEIHFQVISKGLLENDVVLGATLVEMYAKCGALIKAQEVLYGLPSSDTVSWNVLIAGYIQYGYFNEALDSLGWMEEQGLQPDAFTFIYAFKSCGNLKAVVKAKAIHMEVGRRGLLKKCVIVGNALVDMYAKCGTIGKAQEVFEEIPRHDISSWNALINGYVLCGCHIDALNCFQQMRSEGLSPDLITFVCVLKVCSSIRMSGMGKEVHNEVISQGLLPKHVVLGNALVDMYVKCGALTIAQELFDELHVRDVVAWNSLIAGYAYHGYCCEALACFSQMQVEGLFPDTTTFICVMKACGSLRATEKGKEIHAEVSKLDLKGKDMVHIGNALIDMYAKWGKPAKTREVFDKLSVRDVISWNTLIGGYVDSFHDIEALGCFEQMQDEGLSADADTFVAILEACGNVGAFKKGKEIHAEVSTQELSARDIVVGTALIDMYAKCGVLEYAQEVFDELPMRDFVSWSALIAGYAQAGKAEMVFDLFSSMIAEYVEPDIVTFAILLTTCSHAGLLDKGQICFKTLSMIYNILPGYEHQICMVDLFSRAGNFDKAMSMIEKMSPSNCLLWSAVLGACQKWVNLELGKRAFQHAIQSDVNYAGAYVCLGNIYGAASIHKKKNKLEAVCSMHNSMDCCKSRVS